EGPAVVGDEVDVGARFAARRHRRQDCKKTQKIEDGTRTRKVRCLYKRGEINVGHRFRKPAAGAGVGGCDRCARSHLFRASLDDQGGDRAQKPEGVDREGRASLVAYGDLTCRTVEGGGEWVAARTPHRWIGRLAS